MGKQVDYCHSPAMTKPITKIPKRPFKHSIIIPIPYTVYTTR